MTSTQNRNSSRFCTSHSDRVRRFHTESSSSFVKRSPVLEDHQSLSTKIPQDCQFLSFSQEFSDAVLGVCPRQVVIAEKSWNFAHEAGIYDRNTNSVYFTANYSSASVHAKSETKIFRVNVDSLEVDDVTRMMDTVINGNGGCQYRNGLLFCSQGSLTIPSALVYVDTSSVTSFSTSTLVDHYAGRQFNSINDVVVHHVTGDLWFTDPTYGYAQQFRPVAELPTAVYRYSPGSGQLFMIDDFYEMPNGLCFSPDYSTLYVTDTSAMNCHQGLDHGLQWSEQGRATIYAYDVVEKGKSVGNRRVFSRVDNGIPDGIKCDENGNVYTGCGDGIHVFASDGSLMGKILVDGGVANFVFAKGKLWVFNETRLICMTIAAKGCLESIEGP